MIAAPGRGHLANPTNIFDGTPKQKNPARWRWVKRAHAPNSARAESAQHKKTTSSKKTNVSKKTKTPARENALSPVDERRSRTYTKTPQRHENPSTTLTACSVGGWGSIGLAPAPRS